MLTAESFRRALTATRLRALARLARRRRRAIGIEPVFVAVGLADDVDAVAVLREAVDERYR
jgi:hypothetical protein